MNKPHFAAKVKRVVHLFTAGTPSQFDLRAAISWPDRRAWQGGHGHPGMRLPPRRQAGGFVAIILVPGPRTGPGNPALVCRGLLQRSSGRSACPWSAEPATGRCSRSPAGSTADKPWLTALAEARMNRRGGDVNAHSPIFAPSCSCPRHDRRKPRRERQLHFLDGSSRGRNGAARGCSP